MVIEQCPKGMYAENNRRYLNFYDIETDGKTAILYKAVHKQEGEYVSDYDTTFKYIIGGLITEPNAIQT